jgi:hypothetical protein
MLVEFLAVAALVGLFAALAAWLAIAGVDSNHPVLTALTDAVKVAMGALIALAYAARGIARRNNDDDGGSE